MTLIPSSSIVSNDLIFPAFFTKISWSFFYNDLSILKTLTLSLHSMNSKMLLKHV